VNTHSTPDQASTTQRIPPHRLSPESWEMGRRDHELAVVLHESSASDEGYDDLRDEVTALFDRLDHMSRDELRAYIGGMHDHMGEYFW
jgi:hypothetical protein